MVTFNSVSSLMPTVIIVADPHAPARGYSLLGREFFLKEPNLREDDAKMIDGVVMRDKFWVVSLEEYIRVVPEAANKDFAKDVYIPWYAGKVSFKPCYIKS